jgi:hypothetical protein
MPRVARSSKDRGQGHSGGAGIMEDDEYATFPPLPCDRYPSAGYSLPDLRPHPRLSARQHQRSPDRALPPGPSRSPRHPRRITEPRLGAAGIASRTSASSERACRWPWPAGATTLTERGRCSVVDARKAALWTLMALTCLLTASVQICQFWCAAGCPFAGGERASRRRVCGISRHLPDVRAGLPVDVILSGR